MGRKTDPSKYENRIHSVSLTEPAERLYRMVQKVRPVKYWFSQWISQKIIEDFGGDFKIKVLKHELGDNNGRIIDLEKRNDEIIKEVESLRILSGITK